MFQVCKDPHYVSREFVRVENINYTKVKQCRVSFQDFGISTARSMENIT